MIMRNSVQKTSELSQIIYKFDLKGSKVNRQVTQLTMKDVLQSRCDMILKDADFLFVNKRQVVKISVTDKQLVLNQLAKDAKFLSENGIMDYSLLLAVEKLSIDEEGKK